MRSKEVTLFHPPSPMLEKEGMVPPLAPLTLGAILKERGHKVTVIDARDKKVNVGKLTDCDVLIFTSVTTPQYELTRGILQKVQAGKRKNASKHPITAIGGAHASYLSKEIMKDGWDFVCEGWGEKVIAPMVEEEIVEQIISGGVLTEEELNSYPNPDFSLIEGDLKSYKRSKDHKPTLPAMTSRGCPHDCSFCSNESWRRIVRFYGTEKAISMVEDIRDLGISQAVFYDDEALINKYNRVIEISEGIKGFNMCWRCNAHVNTVVSRNAKKIGLLDAISDAGCALVSLGVDGVDNKTLKMFNKETTIEKCEEAINRVIEAGMLVKIYLIYPPGGGLNYTRKMENFVRRTDPDYVGFSVQTPLPGSRDFNRCKIDRLNLSNMYYQSSPGVFGDAGLLNEKDNHALESFNQFLTSWSREKPGMPI